MLKVQDSRYVISAVTETGYPEHDGQEITLLGRSNVGKSTFINRFCSRKKLAYTSARPGKTQTLNFFYINDNLYFVDVPGYGYAKVSKVQREEFGRMIEEYLTQRIKLAFAILLIDFKVGPTEDDILMYKFLKYYHKDVLVIATKKDKVKNSMHHKQTVAIKEKMELNEGDIFYAYSATSNKDVIKLHEIVEEKLGKCS
ncbi:MAG: ribosome biogenesis GTP-binding protein YihA/YsxC [Mycoplasmatales bacterium]